MHVAIGLLTLALAGPPQADSQSQVTLEMVQVTLIEQIQVPALEKGQLAKLDVREGSLVKIGEEVARLDDSQAQIDVRRAEAEAEKAKEESDNDVNYRFAVKSLAVAEAELKRSKEAVEKYPKAIAETELDRLKLTVEKSELQIEQADRDMKVAKITTKLQEIVVEAGKVVVDRHKILAPIDGMVVQVYRHQGEWVNPGDSVVRILRLDRLRVEGFLEARQFGRDIQGRKVCLYVDLPGKPKTPFHGEVVYVSPEVEPVTGQFRVWAEVENADLQLRPGLQGSLVISLTEATASKK